MLPVITFALNNIYCASRQDSQYSFKLIKVTKLPIVQKAIVYNLIKQLPDNNSKYHVFVIGNLAPNFLNLLGQYKEWYNDTWINFQSDMIDRNYVSFFYDDNGKKFPNSHLYYSYIDESSIIIAAKLDTAITHIFTDNYINFRVYSNSYFNTSEYRTSSNQIGIDSLSMLVRNNIDKATIQNWLQAKLTNGGNYFTFVNGIYHDKVTLTIPDGSYVEVIYDQSIASKEYIPISSLRQFTSTKDNVSKYLITRDKVLPGIEYFDDNELFITTIPLLNNKGLYYYRHTNDSMNMVTDKDYSVNSIYINNQANYLSSITSGAIQDKQLVLYIRKSGLNRELVYNSNMLHELYKLPEATQLEVLNGTINSLPELRVENLEDSDYFKVADAPNFFSLTKELCSRALGYDAIAYYFGYNIHTPLNNIVNVPTLYREPSYAYEYNSIGTLLGYYTTSGPEYIPTNPNTRYVEFIQGNTPSHFHDYYNHDASININDTDYRVISALFMYGTRASNWEDITDTTKVVRTSTELDILEANNVKVAIVHLNQPNVYDLEWDISQGYIYFPLQITQDIDGNISKRNMDIPYRNIDIYLNDRRLVQGLSYFIKFPYICICDKKYLDYTLPKQKIHIRCHGYELDESKINTLDITGFVNHGVLDRNNVYDIRDNRLLSIFIDGKLQDRNTIRYAEEDHTVRTSDQLNGLPYIISEPYISIKEVTGLDTYQTYNESKRRDKAISDFFTDIFPEPTIDQFNVIPVRHTLYSPTVSAIIVDVVTGVIPESLYTTPYDDSTIINLIDTNYKHLLDLDPIRYNLQDSLVDIQPHIGNLSIDVNLFQYRFLTNIIRILTSGNTSKVNLSGYISVTA